MVNKPAGMPVHASGRYMHNTVVGRLRNELGIEAFRQTHEEATAAVRAKSNNENQIAVRSPLSFAAVRCFVCVCVFLCLFSLPDSRASFGSHHERVVVAEFDEVERALVGPRAAGPLGVQVLCGQGARPLPHGLLATRNDHRRRLRDTTAWRQPRKQRQRQR